MRKALFTFAVCVAAWLVVPCQAGLKVYYIRHAQQGGNVTKEWAEIPKSRWPDYVGKSYRFTPLGEAQAAHVPTKLAPYHFDFIAVSPTWRTRQTILAYLKAQNRRAEIWPELIEFGRMDGDGHRIGAPDLPPPSDDLLTGGKPIKLSADEEPWFILRPDGLLEPKLGRGGDPGAADLTELQRRVVARLREQFGGTDKSVLLVGHGHAGIRLLRVLTGDPAATKTPLNNIGIWMAEEQPDGRFVIRMINDKPVETADK
jgi:Fructose-2,6-bisphosphatase